MLHRENSLSIALEIAGMAKFLRIKFWINSCNSIPTLSCHIQFNYGAIPCLFCVYFKKPCIVKAKFLACLDNIRTKRNFDRSRKGQRSFRLDSTQSGSNVTVCATISSRHGLMHYIVLPCGMKRDMFCQFLMEVSANVIAEYGSNRDVHMLFDNAPSHRNLDDSLYSHTLPMRRIPKYSHMLNPIECAFSSWKAELKNLLSANQDIFINPHGHGRGEATLSAFRFNQLKALIDERSRAITADKCVAWENHSVTYYARCLQMEDIM